jgi:hypothetical protein
MQVSAEQGSPVWDTGACVGAWRSLVARTVRVGEVPSSNLGAPIKKPRKCVTVQVAAGVSGASGGGEPGLVLGESREGVNCVAALLSAGADVGA